LRLIDGFLPAFALLLSDRFLLCPFSLAALQLSLVGLSGLAILPPCQVGRTISSHRDLVGGTPLRDVAEFLAELGPVAPRQALPVSVAYHDACHLGHAQGIRTQPRELLRAIPGLELREVPEGELCCGSAGIWNILFPEPARELGERKARNIGRTGAELLVTANPGCLMQVASSLQRQGTSIGMAHTVEVLDASIRGLPVEQLLSPWAGRRGRRSRRRRRR
jgi:hypothetical protein